MNADDAVLRKNRRLTIINVNKFPVHPNKVRHMINIFRIRSIRCIYNKQVICSLGLRLEKDNEYKHTYIYSKK